MWRPAEVFTVPLTEFIKICNLHFQIPLRPVTTSKASIKKISVSGDFDFQFDYFSPNQSLKSENSTPTYGGFGYHLLLNGLSMNQHSYQQLSARIDDFKGLPNSPICNIHDSDHR